MPNAAGYGSALAHEAGEQRPSLGILLDPQDLWMVRYLF